MKTEIKKLKQSIWEKYMLQTLNMRDIIDKHAELSEMLERIEIDHKLEMMNLRLKAKRENHCYRVEMEQKLENAENEILKLKARIFDLMIAGEEVKA